MHRDPAENWRGRGGFGPACRRPAIEQGAAARGQAENSAEVGVLVPRGRNPVRHARVASVGTVGSWEGDPEFLQAPVVRRGGARQEATLPTVAPAQSPLQQRTWSAEEVTELCARYAANETSALQQRLNQAGQLLGDSQRQVNDLEKSLQTAIDKIAAMEAEMLQMSRALTTLRMRVPAGGQQAVQQHPRAPTENFAPVPPPAPPARPAAVAPRPPEKKPTPPALNLGARPFFPARPALPAPPPPQEEKQQALALAPRVERPPHPLQGPAQRAMAPPQRLLPGSPAHPDDVFDPSMPDRMPWHNATFEKKSTRDLLDAAFHKVKSAVYSQPYNHIPQTKQPGEFQYVGLSNDHLGKARMTYEMLKDRDRYRLLASGIITAMLVKKIFVCAALLDFPHDQDGHMAAFTTSYQAEQEVLRPLRPGKPNPVVNDFIRRLVMAENRAGAAKNIQRLPRFWKWVTEKAHLIAEDIVPQVDIIICRDRRAFKDTIAQAANEMLRIHIRTLQEPCLYTFEWLGTGYAWVSDKMINRDPHLKSRQIVDEKCPWVTQCMVTPLVSVEKFETKFPDLRISSIKETLLKAEVTLCPRKGNLRQ